MKDRSGRRAWGSARHSFSAIRDEVRRRMGLGEPLTAIYRDLQPPMEYRTFCRHAARATANGASGGAPQTESDRDGTEQKVIHSESSIREDVDPIAAAIRAKAAPGANDRLKRHAAYDPRENTIEELFGVDEHGNPVGCR